MVEQPVVVGHAHDDRVVQLRGPVQQVGDDLAVGAVQRGRRLVGKNQPGVFREHARDRNALVFAAGHLRRTGIAPRLQAHLIEHFLGALRARFGVETHVLQRQHDLLIRRQRRKQAHGLKHETALLPPKRIDLALRQRPDVPPVERHPARIGLLQTAQRRDHRRLARAGRALDQGHFAAV